MAALIEIDRDLAQATSFQHRQIKKIRFEERTEVRMPHITHENDDLAELFSSTMTLRDYKMDMDEELGHLEISKEPKHALVMFRTDFKSELNASPIRVNNCSLLCEQFN